MSASEIYDDLFRQGVFINANGEKIIFEAKTPPAENIIATIKANKNELLNFFSDRQSKALFSVKNILLAILVDDDFREGIKEYFAERAGIYEYEGEYPRAEAEIKALADTINQYNKDVH